MILLWRRMLFPEVNLEKQNALSFSLGDIEKKRSLAKRCFVIKKYQTISYAAVPTRAPNQISNPHLLNGKKLQARRVVLMPKVCRGLKH